MGMDYTDLDEDLQVALQHIEHRVAGISDVALLVAALRDGRGIRPTQALGAAADVCWQAEKRDRIPGGKRLSSKIHEFRGALEANSRATRSSRRERPREGSIDDLD